MIRSGITRKTAIKPSTKRMKASRPKSTPARKAAKGMPCMVRIPGVCNGNPETTVLAHYRLAGYCGIGVKPDDETFGAWCCSSCHNICDGRSVVFFFSRDEIRLMHAEGVLRTQQALKDTRP